MNYYPFHIGDFRSGTVNMTRQARWIYRDMMDVYYDAENPLSLDLDVLCDQLGVDAADERAIVERLLRFKFAKTEDGYTHEVCERVIAEYRAKAETAKANGKLGGRPGKALDNQNKPSGFPSGSDPVASGVAVVTGSEANQEPITKNKRKPKPSSSSGDDGGSPFDQFWMAYPRKVGKQDAQRAWTKLKPDAELVATILAAVAAQLEGADWMREDGQYVPHPATWLNGGRWLDVVRAYVAPTPKLPGGWWEDAETMKAAGLMLDPPLTPRINEGQKAFAHRIRVAIGQADPVPASASMAPPVATPYVPPAPPDDVQLTPEQRAARRDEFKEQMAKLREKSNLPPLDKAA